MTTIQHARCLLFVPGDRPERYAKATSSGADVTIFDLEDAVEAENKDSARHNVSAWLKTEHVDPEAVLVRINGIGTPWFHDDVELVAQTGCNVMVPKIESTEDVAAVATRLTEGRVVVPLIESATGVLAAAEICAAPCVARPALGNIDLANDLSVSPSDPAALTHTRQQLVIAAAAAKIGSPLDGVTAQFDDPQQLRTDAAHAKSLGFSGKLCIHPRQVQPTIEAFRPSEHELAWARQILDTTNDGGATARNGQMLDQPVYERARALLRAEQPTHNEGAQPHD